MTRTVDEAFQILLARLVPTDKERRAGVSHRASVEGCLRGAFGSVRLFRSGSFGHHTSVRGWSDTDYFAVLPKNVLTETSTGTLAKVRGVLAHRFPRTDVAIRFPSVVLPFGSTAAERLEVIPASHLGKVKRFDYFDIADGSGGWMQSSPLAHNDFVDSQNIRHSKRVKPIIRLIKKWNYEKNGRIRSIYIELRIAEFAAGRKTLAVPRDLLAALKHLQIRQLAPMRDPVGLVGHIHPCSDAALPTALTRLATAVSRAEKAIDLERAGRTEEAFNYWDMLFDGEFPSYR